ncbi:MAG: hypothetical protein BGN87_14455 [Rhizobiales bacterium 65-79]|jgi:hypothetical protein|nr:MAG: hypothetical protein BGN87_14455 [Rhizobiales bacterium 65-79]
MPDWCSSASFEARPTGSHLRMREVCAMGAEYQYHAGFHLKVGEVCADLPHPEVRAKRASKDAS